MYLVKIEPIYSQGVGWFELITENKKYIEDFINELKRFKNYLKESGEDIENWEFYEYIFKLVDIDYENNKCKGYCIYESNYSGDEEKISKIIDFDKQIDENIDEHESFEYNPVDLKINYVYNFYEYPVKQIYYDDFDIIGKII